ncbi:MAG: ribose-5-phosphate isomerase RpiA [Thermoplasmata archaeon]|nr:ribose-5-phosphate isomerase RpiA [Thermoplasmata archaeon]
MASDLDKEKLLAAEAAVARVQPGMSLALGTGSTAGFAVRLIAEKFPGGRNIDAVASSQATERYAKELGLAVRPLAEHDHFDLMIDGADEVTPALDLTKGGGAALFREKFLARLSGELTVIVDHTKLVPHLATRSAIPIEVVPYARPVLARMLRDRRFASALRMDGERGAPRLTDNGNEILDLSPPDTVTDPAGLDAQLRSLPGVIETGIFAGMARRVFVGLPDGTVQEIVGAVHKGPKSPLSTTTR